MNGTTKSTIVSAPPPGDYVFGPPGKTATWDAHAWTGVVVESPAQDGLPKWHRSLLPFLRHSWFWMTAGGIVYAAGLGLVWAKTDQRMWAAVTTAPGVVLTLVGAVLLIARHVRFTQLPQMWQIVVVGVGCGVLASALALALEWQRNLWFAGPSEETSKLLFPVLLLAFGGARFRDPRAGLLLVLSCGATFGVIEGILIIHSSKEVQIFVSASCRPLGEVFHPYLTAMAAAVIWLAAWRRGRVITRAGVVAFVIAFVVHTLNDGLIGQLVGDHKGSEGTGTMGWAMAWESVAFTFITYGVGLMVLLYFALRFTSCELVPPTPLSRTRQAGGRASGSGVCRRPQPDGRVLLVTMGSARGVRRSGDRSS